MYSHQSEKKSQMLQVFKFALWNGSLNAIVIAIVIVFVFVFVLLLYFCCSNRVFNIFTSFFWLSEELSNLKVKVRVTNRTTFFLSFWTVQERPRHNEDFFGSIDWRGAPETTFSNVWGNGPPKYGRSWELSAVLTERSRDCCIPWPWPEWRYCWKVNTGGYCSCFIWLLWKGKWWTLL